MVYSKVATQLSKNLFVPEKELNEPTKKRERDTQIYSIKWAFNAHIPLFIECALEIVGLICRAKIATNINQLAHFYYIKHVCAGGTYSLQPRFI